MVAMCVNLSMDVVVWKSTKCSGRCGGQGGGAWNLVARLISNFFIFDINWPCQINTTYRSTRSFASYLHSHGVYMGC